MKQSIKSPIKCIQTGTSKREGNVFSWIASLPLAMTPFGTFNGDNVLKKKAAFTLAEVLITLGIIGIVAAMTMPALIQRNINHTAEARLKKFYSVFNQAIQLAEAEYGDRTFWYSDIGGVQLDENGNPIEAPRKLISGFKNISLNSSPTKKKSKKTAV